MGTVVCGIDIFALHTFKMNFQSDSYLLSSLVSLRFGLDFQQALQGFSLDPCGFTWSKQN